MHLEGSGGLGGAKEGFNFAHTTVDAMSNLYIFQVTISIHRIMANFELLHGN